MTLLKLILKLPKDKPPFIGVQFSNHYDASRTNAEAVYHINGRSCKIVLEPKDHYIDLQIKCEDAMMSYLYKSLDYSPEKLKQWLHLVSMTKQFNFGHVTLEQDDHKIAKVGSGMKNYVIKVESVKLVSEE
jgi:hypothetical protein